MDNSILKHLAAIVGQQHLTHATEDLLCYSYDGTAREFPPEAVIFPGSAKEISRVMQLASQYRFPVVPRGAGTGMTGGALPVTGGLVIAMNRLNRILEIDRDNQVAVVEPGVITGQFQDEVRKYGLYYPPDPASLKFCTLGGNVAECAGGPSAVKYGVTRDYVLGLQVVLADGRLITTGTRTAKGVVGYDLTRLFVGSEGTLGIVTRIIVSLLAAPEAKTTFLVLCSTLARATGLVAKILATHRPCTLEYMDRTAIGLVKQDLPLEVPKKTEALLLIEVDGDRDSVANQSRNLLRFLESASGVLAVRQASDAPEVEALWKARRSLSPAAFQLRPHKISEDVVVPRSKIPELVARTQELAEELAIPIFTFGHAGDGNIHVNIMLDRDNPREKEQAERAKEAVFQETIRLGGTLSGEHGIGITKAAYLPMELDETSLAAMEQVKDLFDPLRIMNPGKIFPREIEPTPSVPKND